MPFFFSAGCLEGIVNGRAAQEGTVTSFYARGDCFWHAVLTRREQRFTSTRHPALGGYMISTGRTSWPA